MSRGVSVTQSYTCTFRLDQMNQHDNRMPIRSTANNEFLRRQNSHTTLPLTILRAMAKIGAWTNVATHAIHGHVLLLKWLGDEEAIQR